MSKEANALSLERVISLLHLRHSDIKQIGRKQIYATPIGRIYYRGSKNYGLPNKDWWYSIDPTIINEEHIDYLCLAADYLGVFLIPSDKFLEYRQHNQIGKVKGGREDFTIVKHGASFIRKESKCQNWNITQYFITIRDTQIQ